MRLTEEELDAVALSLVEARPIPVEALQALVDEIRERRRVVGTESAAADEEAQRVAKHVIDALDRGAIRDVSPRKKS